MSVETWLENHELFARELQTGHRWAIYAAEVLCEHGVNAQALPLTFRPSNSVEDRSKYYNEFDLLVEGYRVDVKSRRLSFTSPGDYPYDTAIVDTVQGWKRKTDKPVAVLLVSQLAKGIVVVPPSQQHRWTKVTRFDSVRKCEFENYEAPRDDLKTLEEFIEWIRP